MSAVAWLGSFRGYQQGEREITEAHDAPPISSTTARHGAHSSEIVRMAAELSAAAVEARWESLRRTARRAATRDDAGP